MSKRCEQPIARRPRGLRVQISRQETDAAEPQRNGCVEVVDSRQRICEVLTSSISVC
jgi:hypothetical protein